MVGAAYGFADVGPYSGGRAELLRVICGDRNCLVMPEEARERRTDYVMLSGMFPTVWHAAELARRPGPGREGRAVPDRLPRTHTGQGSRRIHGYQHFDARDDGWTKVVPTRTAAFTDHAQTGRSRPCSPFLIT
jgi:hypothetical protein